MVCAHRPRLPTTRWLFSAPAATEPAVELERRVVTVNITGCGRRTMFAIAWDTDRAT
ncbi:hypothetical protein AB0F91_41880 [Amycolatopsis sp. NPDC023774]|uniref:hypothetical protein n=1 Tax=Amycolatopsis sp. NPDC023774 TaxID=3155015 RepID=UPI0033D93DBC